MNQTRRYMDALKRGDSEPLEELARKAGFNERVYYRRWGTHGVEWYEPDDLDFALHTKHNQIAAMGRARKCFSWEREVCMWQSMKLSAVKYRLSQKRLDEMKKELDEIMTAAEEDTIPTLYVGPSSYYDYDEPGHLIVSLFNLGTFI